MGKIDDITANKIKEAANIVDVIGDFLTLKKRGVEYLCLCPFHDDKTIGSFSVNPVKGLYKCFACEASGDSVQFLMDYAHLSYPDALRYLAKKYSIYIDDDSAKDERWANVKPATPKALTEAHKDMLVMPRDVVRDVVKNRQHNIFMDWFRHLPWNAEQKQRVEETLWLYCVGPWSDGRVVFWQIDEQGRPRGGKLMRYLLDGHRDKSCAPGWVHNQDGVRERCDLEHHEYRATLFGLHLLNRYPDATVNVVESEKTALVCACAYGIPKRNIWLATGGLRFLKPEVMQPLIDAGRRVWLWPDKDGVGPWRAKAKEMLSDRVTITTRFLTENWIEEDGPKADVADVILRVMARPESVVCAHDHSGKPNDAETLADAVVDDEPFVDLEEMIDPRVRVWRERMSHVHSAGWGLWPPCKVDGVSTIGEVIGENEIIEKLMI